MIVFWYFGHTALEFWWNYVDNNVIKLCWHFWSCCLSNLSTAGHTSPINPLSLSQFEQFTPACAISCLLLLLAKCVSCFLCTNAGLANRRKWIDQSHFIAPIWMPLHNEEILYHWVMLALCQTNEKIVVGAAAMAWPWVSVSQGKGHLFTPSDQTASWGLVTWGERLGWAVKAINTSTEQAIKHKLGHRTTQEHPLDL